MVHVKASPRAPVEHRRFNEAFTMHGMPPPCIRRARPSPVTFDFTHLSAPPAHRTSSGTSRTSSRSRAVQIRHINQGSSRQSCWSTGSFSRLPAREEAHLPLCTLTSCQVREAAW